MSANTNTNSITHQNITASEDFLELREPSASTPTEPYADVPEELKALDNWVVWKYETRNDRETKPPFDANTSGSSYAKTNNSNTWVSFDKAVDVADILSGNDVEGIGFVFTDMFQGADLDGVVQTVHNIKVIDPFALAIAKLTNTFCEYSPSGSGVHLIWQSSTPLPSGNRAGNKKLGGELYDKNSPRFFTVTGDKVPEISANTITEIKDPGTVKLLHFLVLNTHNKKLTKLWLGEWQETTDSKGKPFPSQSEADLALCNALVRGGFNSFEKLDAAFRKSGLMRPEWEHKGTHTVAKALSGKESHSSKEPEKTRCAEIISIRACDVVPLPIEFLWEPYLQQNALNAFYGNPGGGKGNTGLDIVARLTTARLFPTESTTDRKPINCVTLAAEEGVADTIVPRLMAAQADLARVRIVRSIRYHDLHDKIEDRIITFQKDMAALKADLLLHPEERYLFIDPITNYVGDINFNQDGEVRPVLTLLAQLAEELKITVTMVGHFNKNTNVASALDKPGGAARLLGIFPAPRQQTGTHDGQFETEQREGIRHWIALHYRGADYRN